MAENKHQITGDSGGGRQTSIPVELSSNSHKSKKLPPEKNSTDRVARPKAERVVSKEGRVKKRGLGDKLRDTLTGEDAKSVGNYIFFDVVVPAFKSMLADAASQGTERLLFGSSSSRSRPRNSRERENTPYNRMSFSRDRERYSGSRELSYRDRATHNFDSVIVDTRPEAEEVLDRLALSIEEYGNARVTDFYEMVGITGSFADDKWGWFNIRDSGVRRVREGYLILLPRPEVID